MGQTARLVILFPMFSVAIADAAAAASSSYRVDEITVDSRDCYVGNTLLPMQDSCCYNLRRILCRNNVGISKVQSPQTETEFPSTATATSTAVQSPQTGVTSSAVNASTMGKSKGRYLMEADQCAGCVDGSLQKTSPEVPGKSPVDPSTAEVLGKSPVDPPKPQRPPGELHKLSILMMEHDRSLF
uniref:Uncharacterized protein n=1 Tax=Musa acuminata subsp. malaccensis TaxID=214687 RepID=A0A804IM62_MUSAM